jgi:hypothetical protein
MEVVCPYCKSGVGGGSDVIRCLECGTRHHWVCWSEHANHCSVFSCQGNFIKVRVRKKSDLSLLLWCIANYAIHLGLPYFGHLRYSLHLWDVGIVAILETLLLGSGLILLRNRRASQPARSFGALLFSSNAAFALFLLAQLMLRGPYGLNALIGL